MIILTENDIDIIDINEFYRHVRFSSLEGYEVEWRDEEAHELKDQILKNMKTVQELNKLIEELKPHHKNSLKPKHECSSCIIIKVLERLRDGKNDEIKINNI